MLVLCAAAISGCFLKPKPPVYAKLPVPSIQVHDDEAMSQDGLDVTVTPISVDNVKGFPQIEKTFAWNKTTPNASGGAAQTTGMTAKVIILPMPAFQVRIANNTGHIVRLTTAVFRLENNVGKKWQTFSSTEELSAWKMAELGADPNIGPDALQQLAVQVQAALGGLQLLTRSVELLRGDEWIGYLVFNFGGVSWADLMNNTERFTLRLAEIPVETDDAGAVSKTTEFTFVLDKASAEVDVVCPPGTKEPSWANGCTRQ